MYLMRHERNGILWTAKSTKNSNCWILSITTHRFDEIKWKKLFTGQSNHKIILLYDKSTLSKSDKGYHLLFGWEVFFYAAFARHSSFIIITICLDRCNIIWQRYISRQVMIFKNTWMNLLPQSRQVSITIFASCPEDGISIIIEVIDSGEYFDNWTLSFSFLIIILILLKN